MLRFGVLWRKRSKGTQSEKGNRWVERVLSNKQTCQMRSLLSFPLLIEVIDSFFKERVSAIFPAGLIRFDNSI